VYLFADDPKIFRFIRTGEDYSVQAYAPWANASLWAILGTVIDSTDFYRLRHYLGPPT